MPSRVPSTAHRWAALIYSAVSRALRLTLAGGRAGGAARRRRDAAPVGRPRDLAEAVGEGLRRLLRREVAARRLDLVLVLPEREHLGDLLLQRHPREQVLDAALDRLPTGPCRGDGPQPGNRRGMRARPSTPPPRGRSRQVARTARPQMSRIDPTTPYSSPFALAVTALVAVVVALTSIGSRSGYGQPRYRIACTVRRAYQFFVGGK